jgi:hypothetical protein
MLKGFPYQFQKPCPSIEFLSFIKALLGFKSVFADGKVVDSLRLRLLVNGMEI